MKKTTPSICLGIIQKTGKLLITQEVYYMLRKKNESVEWLEFEQLQKFSSIKHGVFLRSGGKEFFLHGEGQTEQAKLNRNQVSTILECHDLIQARQCHSAHVLEVSLPWDEKPCDGLITDKAQIGLLMKHADCQIAIFYDPVQDVISAVHAGWRGMVSCIYKEAIDRMKERYGTLEQNLLVCISPSLGPCCAEFKNYRCEFPESFWKHQEKENYFNLWEVAKEELTECGVLPSHIEIAEICTVCHAQDFYSYRRDKTTLRNGTAIALRCKR